MKRSAAALLAASLAALAACGSETQPQSGTRAVANEGWQHVAIGSTPTYASNPPASGPHYPAWARYKLHTEVVPRGYWLHNVEHGGVVLLRRPDVSSEAAALLEAAYDAIPIDPACGTHKRALLTVDPELDDPIAAVSADEVLELTTVDAAAIRTFVEQRRGMGPEDVCLDGTFP